MEGFFLQAYLYIMAGIFKNLDQSDLRLTPFRAYKRFSGTDAFTTYSAILDVNAEDLGNNPLIPISSSYFTTNYKLKNSIWHSIDSQFYRHYYSNAKASFGQLNHTQHFRFLHQYACVISIPQSNFGEGIEPLTVQLSTNSGVVLVDDAYGNLVKEGTARYVTGTQGLPSENLVFILKPANYTRQLTKVLNDNYPYSYDKYQANVEFNNVLPTTQTNQQTSLRLDNSSYDTSSIVIQPNGEVVNNLFNFENRDFAIVASFKPEFVNTSSILLQKKSSEEIIKVDENGNTYKYPIFRYPYSLTYLSGSNKILFEKSDGYTTLSFTSSFTYNSDYALTLMRTGSTYVIAQAGNGTLQTNSFADTLYSNDHYCTNKSDIYIGCDQFGNSGSILTINKAMFYNTAFNISESLNLSIYNSIPNNTYGIVARKQGLIIVDDPTLGTDTITNVEYRGTTTIYENEASCTISPGEFGFSNNPTLHYYNSERNRFELQDFATGSDFRPYVSRVGLYNDSNDLLVIGTLSHPIQPPQNVDTTFILRYDM